ncbi:DNA-binding transcriptional regulator [Enterobacter ludwigii]|nr:DNA-binding transcriptional regulator [Enterobacter ludwigii]
MSNLFAIDVFLGIINPQIVNYVEGYMFHCPKCKHSAHARTSRYLSENTKERYHQCTNVDCSCTFVTMESVERLIATPGAAERVRTASQTHG